MRSVGIDIGHYRIKVAEVESHTKAVALTQYFEVPLNPQPGQDATIARLEALRSVLNRYPPGTAKMVVGLRQEFVSLRHKIFPFRERHKLLRSVPFELEDEVPFDPTDAVFDVRTVRYRGKASEVLAVVAPKPPIQELLQLCLDSNLDPDIISVEGLAASNLLQKWSSSPEEGPAETLSEEATTREEGSPIPASLVLDIGHARTLCLVVHEGNVILARSFYFGGQDLIESIRKRYDLPYHEAVKALEERGFVLTSTENATQDQKVFSETLTGTLQRLIDDLRLSILDLRSQNGIRVEQIQLLGGVSQLINLAPYFSGRLEIAATLANPVANFSRLEFAVGEQAERRALVAFGLALEGLRKARHPAINLRRQEFARESESPAMLWERWKKTVQLAAACLASFYVYSYLKADFAMLADEQAQDVMVQQAKDSGLKGSQLNISGIEKFIREKRKEIRDRQTLAKLKDYKGGLDLLQTLSQNAPGADRSTIDIRRFFLLENKLSIEGAVNRREDVGFLRDSLRTMASDRKVRELTPSTISPGRVGFAFEINVSRLDGTKAKL